MEETQTQQQLDPIAVRLRNYGQNLLILIFGLLPLLFLPTALAPFEYTKVIIVVASLLAAAILYSLSVLRSGTINIGISWPLVALWGVALVSLISALLSGDIRDAFIGDLFSVHSAIFVILLALIPTIWSVLRANKFTVMKMYVILALSTLALVIFHVLRIVFGADFLTFNIFTGSVSTPVGAWNDLALLLGLTIILSLVALEQLSLTKVGRILFGAVTVGSLFMLSVINFFSVWVVLGLSSLVMIVYTLGKDRFSGSQLSLTGIQNANTASLIVALLVFACAALFVIGGSELGGWVANKTGVSYVEVRPSFEATMNIARDVYRENALLGIGPNKFSDAWRLYKDPAINTTVFWNTDFRAGNGYITTFFVTTGILGALAWLIFFGTYIYFGIRRLLNATVTDKVWYFIGVSSFVSAVYIWGMSFIYVTGVVMLLLAAVCTGVSLHAFKILGGEQPKTLTVGNNRRTGFVLIIAVIVVIVGSVSVLYMTGRHYSSVYAFNESIRSMQQQKDIGQLEQEVFSALSLSSSDVFARRIAEFQLERLGRILNTPQPTEAQVQEFNDAAVNGLQFALEAVRLDPQEPLNWSVLAGVYNMFVLGNIDVEEATTRLREALAKYKELNPKNPLPYHETAIIEARAGNAIEARTNLQEAIRLKPNYTEAYFALVQLDIAEGNVDAAVQSTRSIISLEPQNPVRYYQLGVLLSAQSDVEGSIRAYEQAVALDQDYANARYLLALALEQQGRVDEALFHLERVAALNPDNQDVSAMVQTLKSSGSLSDLRTPIDTTVNETQPTTDEQGSVSVTEEPDTNLVSPVNTPPRESEADEG